MTRAAINNSLFLAGLVLQAGLLALVFLRGIARKIPSFTLLLLFYPMRALVLFVLPRLIGPSDFGVAYRELSLFGLLLQLIVAAEIAWRLWRVLGATRWGLLLVPVIAWVGALALWAALPARAPLPVDRVQMFCSMVMILLCGFALAGHADLLLRRVIAGLAVFGVVDLIATAGKSLAAMHRDATGFAVWSYADAGCYLLVVLFWMVSLRDERTV
jgi:hypothetical protein